MTELWDIALAEAIKAKGNVVQWWSGENEANAGLPANGAVLGLNWDSTGYNLRKDGYKYIAPKEGAFAWHQGFVMMKNAKNVDQAHEFIKCVATPEGAAVLGHGLLVQPGRQGRDRSDGPGGQGLLQRHLPRRGAEEAVVVAGADRPSSSSARRVRRQVQGRLIADTQETAGFRLESGGFLLRCENARWRRSTNEQQG